MNNLSVTDLQKILSAPRSRRDDFKLIDVRQDWEFEYCHIDESIHIPLSKIPSFLEAAEKDETFVFICHHGIRSANATAYALSLGFGNALNLTGGLDAWSRDVDQNFPRY